MLEKKSKPEKGLLYILIGIGVSGVLAFLFAPKTKKHLRGDIDNTARKSLDKTEELTAESSEKRQTFFRETKIKADQFYESAKRTIDSAAASINEKTGEIQNAAGNNGAHIDARAAAGKKKSNENKNSDRPSERAKSR